MAEENAVIEKQSSEGEGTQKELTFEIDEAKEKDSSEEVQSEIQLEDSSSTQDEGEDKELKEHSMRVQKRINTLTYRAKEGERVADEAMNYAKGVLSENDALKRRLSGQENVSISEAEQRNISQMAEAKTALKAAHEAADSDAIADASELIGKLASDGNAIHQAKRRMDAQKAVEEATPAQAPAPATAQQNVPTQEPEVVEDPKAEAWAAKTKWFGQHEGMTHYAMTQHYSLVEKEGFDPHSDEYYNEIENRVQKTFPHMFESASESSASDGAHQAVNGTKPKQTVAPARNSSGSAKKNNKITVSTSEQTVARGLGISNEAYAREKARLQKERDAENA